MAARVEALRNTLDTKPEDFYAQLMGAFELCTELPVADAVHLIEAIGMHVTDVPCIQARVILMEPLHLLHMFEKINAVWPQVSQVFHATPYQRPAEAYTVARSDEPGFAGVLNWCHPSMTVADNDGHWFAWLIFFNMPLFVTAATETNPAQLHMTRFVPWRAPPGVSCDLRARQREISYWTAPLKLEDFVRKSKGTPRPGAFHDMVIAQLKVLEMMKH